MDRIRRLCIVFRRADVGERVPVAVGDGVNVRRGEGDAKGLWVVATERMELAGDRVEQGKPGAFGAFLAGDEMDFIGHPGGVLCNAQGIEGFGDDLR